MATIDNSGKVAYVYDSENDTWRAIFGQVNTAASYEWSGSQSYDSVLTAKAGINNFINPAARDAAISSPTNGIVCFVRNDSDGSAINQIQYYYNGTWKSYDGYANLSAKTNNYTLVLTDAGKTVTVSSSDSKAIYVPANSAVAFPVGSRIDIIRLGSGELQVIANAGVTIQSKSGNLAISSQYSGATLVKIDTNTWVLVGDLKYSGAILVVD